ncbi:tRNA (N(6)-L-threonylcarbamoyladenosine(37)-C(2))-methylthiotransferase [Candidatus Micrarchaeota archaeon]|nr:tRNA (N(6)-L-threonylcarbamoyladenosine(37)-C(2))-methylthiotransferase [Candidatus Micrarchaeota archaeon]
MKVWIETYGCTLNHADSDIIRGILEEAGHTISKDAKLVILNTCSVKETTENKIISKISRLKKEGKKVIVAGCLGINEKRVRSADENAVILLPDAVSEILRAIDSAIDNEPALIGKGEPKGPLPRVYTSPIQRIAVQEGCVGNCHFCQTKIARPKLKSLTIREIRRIAEHAAANGALEIQLAGQDTGAYGMDIGATLPRMLEEVLSVEGNFMVRLGMINPSHAKRMLPELLRLLENEKFYKFLHIPVQTGSERVRQEMNRLHSVSDFEDVVNAARRKFPDITISTDIIVGYPTETKEDFEKSCGLLERVSPDIVNVSKFSSRRGTYASTLKKIPTEEVKRRSTKLSRLVHALTTKRNSRYLGREAEVLITEIQKTPTGRMQNYKQVCVEGGRELLGKKLKAKIISYNHGSLFGQIIN